MRGGITTTSVCVTIAAGVFLVLDVTGTADHWSVRFQVSDHDFTLITAFAAVALWLVRWRMGRDKDKTLLIKTLADAVPAQRTALAKTLPLRRVL